MGQLYDSNWNSYSAIHGVDYLAGEGLFSKENAEKIVGYEAVCVVCQSARSTQVDTNKNNLNLLHI